MCFSVCLSNFSESMIDIFKKMVFLSLKGTQSLCHKLKINHVNKKEDLQGLYHFEAKYFQYSILRHNVRFIKDLSQNKEYFVFKFGHVTRVQLYGVCEVNNRFYRGAQPWHCRSIVTLKQMMDNFGITNVNHHGGSEHTSPCPCQKFAAILSMTRPSSSSVSTNKSQSESNNKRYDSNLGYKINFREIKNKLIHGYEEHDSKIQQQWRQYYNSNKNAKTRNQVETKYDYLDKIATMMKIDRAQLLNIKLGAAIKNAFEFVTKYPQTALTQVYIGETERKIEYELVLLAEIPDVKNEKFYKFGVPVVKHTQSNGHVCYVAKTILTPFMAIHNVRLNFAGNQFENKSKDMLDDDSEFDALSCNGCKGKGKNMAKARNFSWIDSIGNANVSFYQQIDASWYN